ncbi:MAG: hypothetical protein G01um101430_559 [Parcubacteria group bacterium Gr01-1014_30]|nr:MAG: hypothetical protein G01um101430_559 [Parcubacteria group bacterium Gr01-1014_30]
MLKKNLLLIVILLLLIGVGGFAFFVLNKETLLNMPKVFASKEQCEAETNSPCIRYLCDIPIGDLYQKLCTNGSGTGWYNAKQIGIEEEVPQEPSGEPREISFQKVDLHTDWRLKKSYDYSIYRGIFRTEAELKNIWKYMVNAYDEVSGLPFPKNPNQPVMSEVDFDKYSVVWYADRGSNASFVTMKKMVEYQNLIEAHLALFYSDFGSSHLNLWTIPKTEKEIRFVETKEYEQRGP